jgi:hypothetical protein
MSTSYDVEQWAAETVRGRHIYNYQFRLDGGELRGWKLVKTVVLAAGEGVEEKAYLWQSKEVPERELVRIDIAESPDWRSAQKRLLEILSQSMRPDIPRGTGQLMALGDVNFVAREPQSDVPAAIAFTLGNVCVAVRSVERRTVDVSEIATRVERALREPPAKKEIEKKRWREKVVKAAMKAGKPHKLFKNLGQEIQRDTWLKVIAPAGELRRDRKALVFVPGEGGEIEVLYYLCNGKITDERKSR